ncbi:hypothetical protein [Devosia sp. XK-2]|uniref:hypothetical protein n=1 Tax=Devosia sp. XK-2 TaxID=3126689 RepID=UPI0030CBC3C1
MTIDRFELRRRSDDLVYVFVRAAEPGGRSGFRRADGDYWIVFEPDLGWVAWNDESQDVAGRPWNTLPTDQPLDAPPEGEWVSKKGAKSYVYDLVYI